MKKIRRLAVVIALILFVTGTAPRNDSKWVYAEPQDATPTTQEKIDQTKEEKNNLEDLLDGTKGNLDSLKNSQQALKQELDNLNAQMEEIAARLSEYEEQIREVEQQIQDTQAALEEAQAAEEEQYNSMVIRVRDMYERNDTSYVNAIISAGSWSEMLNVADYFEKIATYDRRAFDKLKETRQLVEDHETRLRSDRAKLENLKVATEAEKDKVEDLISKTANYISQFGDQISEEEKRALAYEAAIKEKEKDIEYLNKKLAEEQALSRTAAQSSWRDISDLSFTEGDRYLLANLIYCEAGGEPYEGQIAVGAVVINRMRSAVFPDSIEGVIYQNKQFSPVASGRLALALASDKATERCYQAADAAMSGTTNVGDCLFFRTPIPGLTGISIGGHIFY